MDSRSLGTHPFVGLAALTACGPAGFQTLPETGEEIGDGDGDMGDGDGDGDTFESGTDETEGETDGGPFELLSGHFEDSDTIVLTFSNPLGSLASVEPAAFRISLGYTNPYVNPYGEVYGGSYYWDPNYIGYSYYPGYYYFRVNALYAGPQSHQLRLAFDHLLDPTTCDLMDSVDPQPPAEIGLYTHYAPGGVPLRDNLGVALAPIGPEWAELAASYQYSFYEPGFPNLDPKIEIPCPF